MQTAAVHCRDPRRFINDLGPRRALAVLAMFTGGFAGPLVGPLLTSVLLFNSIYGDLLTPRTNCEIALSTLWCFLAFSGVAAIIWPLLLGMRRRRLARFWPALLLLPLWHLMLSVAAWRALIELWTRPFHWNKTSHGLTPRGDSMTPTIDVRRTARV